MQRQNKSDAGLNLARVLKEWRYAARLGVREAAKAIGIDPSTLNRIENGDDPGGRSLATILKWLLTKSQEPKRS